MSSLWSPKTNIMLLLYILLVMGNNYAGAVNSALPTAWFIVHSWIYSMGILFVYCSLRLFHSIQAVHSLSVVGKLQGATGHSPEVTNDIMHNQTQHGCNSVYFKLVRSKVNKSFSMPTVKTMQALLYSIPSPFGWCKQSKM